MPQKKTAKKIVIQFLPYLTLFAAANMVYGKSLRFDFIASWDDREYVINNELIRSISLKNLIEIFTTTTHGNYAPIHILSYVVDFSLWDLSPWGYHLTNLILHGFNVCLVYALLQRLTETKALAFFSAFLFAVHPLNVENVAWISERKSLLSSLFFLLAFISYMRFRKRGQAAYYFLCVFLFILSVLAKASSVILPFVLISYDVYLRRQRIRFAHIMPLFIIFLFGMATTVWAHFMTKAIDKGTLSYDILFNKVYPTMIVVYWKYIWLIVAPFKLSGFYDAVLYESFLALPVVSSVVAWICLFFIVFIRGTSQVRFWFLWFWICFLPTANIIPIPVYYADRYMYMPAIGFFTIIGIGLNSIIRRSDSKVFERAVYGAAAGIIIFYGIVSFERLDVWRNELAFWEDTVAKSPNQDRVHLNLGTIYELNGRLIEAEREYRRAIAIYPSDDAFYNIRMVREKIKLNNKEVK